MRAALLCLITASLFAAGCAAPTRPAADAPAYRVIWTAKRASDQILLASATSPVVRVGASIEVKTDSLKPLENQPAFPEFTAHLGVAKQRDAVELVTRASVREAMRNKKGKLKVSKRFIGALLPIKSGETLGVNGPGDPIIVQVRIEPAR